MLNADFGLSLLSFEVKFIGMVSTFLIFILRVEYSLQKLEVRVEKYLLLGVISHPK